MTGSIGIKKTASASIMVASIAIFSFTYKPSKAENLSIVEKDNSKLPELPISFDGLRESDSFKLYDRPLTLVPEIQTASSNYIRRRGNPVAAALLVSVRSGEILAMAQGRSPEKWGAKSHTALHVGFPAASIFKTTVSAGLLEFIDTDTEKKIGLAGGCARVNKRGVWMRNDISGPRHSLSLRRAYGSSCNGFFAKIAVNELGFGPILEFAKKFGWNASAVATDFLLSPSPIDAPDPMAASAHTVGRFAAGFGKVGLSAVHAAWQAIAIANQGKPKSIRIFKDSENLDQPAIISPKTAKKLLDISEASVQGGTASSSFRDRRYRKLRSKVGGKTGTLTGYNPKGVTTWFVGSYPLDNPEVVIVTVTVLEDLWQFRASTLAAETLLHYQDWKNIQTSLVNSESSALKKN